MFQIIFANPHIVHITYKYLEPIDIFNTKDICRDVYNASKTVEEKTNLLGNRFKEELINENIPQSLFDLIYKYNGYISGSRVLKFIDKSTESKDIDVYMPENAYNEMEKYFFNSQLWYGRHEQWDYHRHGCPPTVSINNVHYIDHLRRITPFYRIVDYKVKDYIINDNNRLCDREIPIWTKIEKPIQIIYLKTGIDIKQYIQATFDIDALKNYFNGKSLSVNFIHDIISKRTNYHVSSLLTGIPVSNCLYRIKKYQERGYIFNNLINEIKTIYIDGYDIRCKIIKVNNQIISASIPEMLFKSLYIYAIYKFNPDGTIHTTWNNGDECISVYQTLYRNIYHSIKDRKNQPKQIPSAFKSFSEMRIIYNKLLYIGKQLGYKFIEKDIDLCQQKA